MITTGPQRAARASDLLRDQRTYLHVVRKIAVAAIIILALIGGTLIAVVIEELGQPSVYVGGVACLIVSALAVGLVVLLDMHRATARALQRLAESDDRLRGDVDGLRAQMTEVVRIEHRLSTMTSELNDELARRRKDGI